MVVVGVVQVVLMVDNRLLEIGQPSARELKRKGLAWFIDGENDDYIAPEVLRLSEAEMEHFRKDANEVYDGEWANNRPEGNGILKVNGQEFMGRFIKGKFIDALEYTVRF